MFRTLPPFGGDQRQVAEVVRGLMDGKSNNTGSITLNQGVTSTTINDRRIGADSIILFMPLNDKAAQEIGIGNMYISSRGQGTATITHQNTMHDAIFAYAVIG